MDEDPSRDPTGPESGVVLQLPVRARNVPLAVLAACAVVFVLDWAAAVFIPLLLGLILSQTLSPIVDRMQAWRIPRAIGAGVLLLAIVGGVGATIYSLQDDATELIASLPDAAKKLRQVLQPHPGASDSAIDKVQQAATEIEKTATEGAAPVPATRGVTRVQIERPKFDINKHLWTSTLGLATFVGQATVVCFLTFFLLISGDTFRRKAVRIAGPTFKTKRITVEALDEISAQIKRYLLVQVFTSSVVGVATWLVFLWIGLEYAAVWGVLAGVLNLIPYLGAIAVTGGAALVGLVQFGTLPMALLVGGASFAIQSLEGNLLTPWLTGRASRMSPVVVFVGVLAWGWLWGIWGLLLGVPILMITKAVCDRIEGLTPIGELLGD